MFAWPRNSRSTSGYCGFGCIYFCYFNILYVFEVVESVSCSFAKLPCPDDLENPNQLPVSQVLEDTDDWVLWIFVIFSLPTFSGSRNPFLAVSQSYCLGDLEKSRPTSGLAGARGYWWLSLMNLRNFFVTYVFEIEESIPCSFTKLLCLGDLENPRSTSGFAGARGYWWLSLMEFRNFFITYVFGVEESIPRSFTKLLCLGDLENLGQLLVYMYLRELLQRSVRPNHQYPRGLWNRKLSWIFKVF